MTRLALTSALLAALLAIAVVALDNVGGHPAKSSPLVLAIVIFLVLFPLRLWRKRRKALPHPEKG